MRSRIRQFAGRLFLVVVICVGGMCLLPWGDNAQAFALVDLGTFTNPTAGSLGSVNSYAVFANDYYKNNHMEGTIATKTLHFGSSADNFGLTTNVDGYVNGDENFLYFENIDKPIHNMGMTNTAMSNVILPNVVTIDMTYNNGNGFQLTQPDDTSSVDVNALADYAKSVHHIADTTYQIDFADAFSGLKSYASTQYAKADTSGVVVDTTGASDTVDHAGTITVTCPDGNDVVNLTADQIADNSIVVLGEGGTKNYSLIINVKGAGTSERTFNNALYVDGTGSENVANGYKPTGGKVMWNFGTQSADAVFKETAGGVILAPSGDVKCIATHNGSIFASTVTNDGCEIHLNPFRTVKPQSSSAVADISVKKAVSGEGAPDESFEFTLSAGTNDAGVDTPMPSGTGATTTVKGGETGSFGLITFTKDGTYNYTITEKNAGTVGMSYSGPHTVAVVVTGTGTEAATATVSYDNGAATVDPLTITNTYVKPVTPTASFRPEVSKSVTGDAEATARSFAFTLSAGTNDAGVDTPMPSGTGATTTAKDGKTGVFGTITYTKAGTYNYVISETTASGDGYICDTTAHALVVTVAVVDGRLSVSATYDGASSLTIINTHTATHSVILSKKVVNGTDELSGATLELLDADGKVIETWTSSSTAKVFELVPGTYVMAETTAPAGYDVAEDITFTVAKDGKVSVDGVEQANATVTMFDGAKPTTPDVPTTPDTPDTPDTPTTPEASTSVIPQTSDLLQGGALFGMAGLLVSVVGLVRRRVAGR